MCEININNKSGSNPHELEYHKLQLTSSPRSFPLVNLKRTAEQTFIFLDTPDPRSYKKTHGQTVVLKEDPVAKRIVITDNTCKVCQFN